MDEQDLTEQFELSMQNSITTEVEMGITFASIALDSTGEKCERNRRNARKAYDKAIFYCGKYPVRDPELAHELDGRLERFRQMLLRLGENLD